MNSIKKIVNNEEMQYLNLIRDILQNGDKRICRNGTTYSVFGRQMRFNLRDNSIPFITTKRLAWKTCLRELLWFVKGDTDNEKLIEKNVHIWDGNASKDFLESRGLDYEEGDLGPVYGFQWRNFNGDYINKDNKTYNGVDQLEYVIKALKNNSDIGENKYSRRLIVSAWNPVQLNKMALPPCHVMFQFYVNSKDELSCSLYQRSGDVGLGVPFNIASYSFLTYMIAKHCDLRLGDFVYNLGDCHIYDDHIEALKIQVEREPFEFPKLYLDNKRENIEDYLETDFRIENYDFHNKISMKMRV
jgi:thymidylate synthase